MHSSILKPKFISNYKNKPMNTLPFHERLKFNDYNCEQFSAIINPTQNFPSWSTSPQIVNTSLTRYPKTSTNPTVIHQSYYEILSLYPNSEHIYTDASKTQSGLAAAYIHGADHFKIRLPLSCSIFTGEALAILEALKVCRRKSAPHYIIISDSLSTLKALQQLYPSNEIIMPIKNELMLLSTKNIEITFLWVPLHVGIKENEAVDQLANEAALDESIPVSNMLTRNDHKTSIKKHITNLWQSNWKSTTNKLKDVIETVGTTLPLPLKRCEQVIITRLRLGHTIPTHIHLINKEAIPFCHNCNIQITVKHILLEFKTYTQERRKNNLPTNMKDLLSCQFNQVLKYLKDIKFYSI
uniref:Uncharacterized protein LOC114333839 n=1 Tax=Diabrotica virgifera virgifera TaxID=50390 RepID=A0A6P7FT74_DIAVI